MARYALIRDGSVAEMRDVDPAKIATHKLADDGGPLLRPVVDPGPPDYRKELAVLSTNISVEKTQVLVSYDVVPKGDADQRAAVKAEARRRILARLPDWKQQNMTARGVELQDIWRRAGSWSPEEQAEADALAGEWAWIKDVRAASDAIEALGEIPIDYDADERWPA